ncbi:glycosyltransferase family 4 protein [Erythrobacter aureus]|uniref:Glycosyltransferase WbuB n=1 Tax=Erythrobacter aureus TaxID=2182384 RepID=A0A345YFY7_9SPHN|nr:glycosyltransferase family 4 protein [Erythrobacter aureus]AXK42839.1 glycosyltransferase WbuB [Erythrobacter aureus]
MKNVWMLNHYAIAPNESGGTRHFSLSRHLRDYGWESSIVAASIEHDNGKQRLETGRKWRIDFHDGVRFLWLRTPPYRGNGGGRMMNMLAYCLRACQHASTRDLPRPDVIIGSSVHPFAAVSGAFLARRFGVPFIFEVRDLWPQTLIDLGRLEQNSGMAKVMRKIELWLYQRAARIVVLLPGAGDYIEPLGIDRHKIIWLPNGVELEGAKVPEPAANDDEFIVMYFGAHGTANGIENILRAFAILEKRAGTEGIVLQLIGDGPAKPTLMELANDLQLKRVTFKPPVPKSQIPTLAEKADAFVFNLIAAPVFKYGISSNKLFDYLAAARPIIFCSDAANNPIDEARAGVTVPPDSPQALADAIVQLAAIPADQRAQMGRAGRKYVEAKHSYQQLARELAAILDDVADSNK